ncbi:MAG: hypothetical protein Fur0044_39450 [Anaerolineae bacterium]|nr:hypothetical protein [Anaerolineales bacterium]MCQ3972609.1 hypothetical protein [Anaerolineae bacterium]
MTLTKTIQTIQAEYAGLNEAISSLTAEQTRLQHRLVALNLVHQFKQHGVVVSQPIWHAPGVGLKIEA